MTQKRIPMTDKARKANQPYDIDVIPAPTAPTKTSKVFNWVAIGALLIVAAALALMLKWSLVDTNVLVVHNAPFPVRTIRQHAETGGVVILDVDLCKNSSVVGKTRTSFVSSSREVFLPEQDERLGKGCLKTEVPVVIPKDLPADTYKIKFRSTYNLNPLKKGVVSTFESKEFVVDPGLPTTP